MRARGGRGAQLKLSDRRTVPVGMSEGTGAVIPYVIIAAVVAQLFYAQTMRTKGVLR